MGGRGRWKGSRHKRWNRLGGTRACIGSHLTTPNSVGCALLVSPFFVWLSSAVLRLEMTEKEAGPKLTVEKSDVQDDTTSFEVERLSMALIVGSYAADLHDGGG